MKSIKVKKSWLKDPVRLLKEVGATYEKQGFPSDVYISRQDYRYMLNSLRKEIKKQHPGVPKDRIETTLGYEMLNFGPCESLIDAVKPGYVLVDDRSIARQKAELQQNIGR